MLIRQYQGFEFGSSRTYTYRKKKSVRLNFFLKEFHMIEALYMKSVHGAGVIINVGFLCDS